MKLLGRSVPNHPEVVAASTSVGGSNVSEVTLQGFSIPNGSSKIFVFVYALDATLGNRTVASVTHNSQDLSLVASSPTDDGLARIEIWELDDPSAGISDVVVTMGGSCGSVIAAAVSVDKFGLLGDVGNEITTNSSDELFNIELDDHSLYLVGVGLVSADLPANSGGLVTLSELFFLGVIRFRVCALYDYPGGTLEVGWTGAVSSADWVSSSIEVKTV